MTLFLPMAMLLNKSMIISRKMMQFFVAYFKRIFFEILRQFLVNYSKKNFYQINFIFNFDIIEKSENLQMVKASVNFL